MDIYQSYLRFASTAGEVYMNPICCRSGKKSRSLHFFEIESADVLAVLTIACALFFYGALRDRLVVIGVRVCCMALCLFGYWCLSFCTSSAGRSGVVGLVVGILIILDQAQRHHQPIGDFTLADLLIMFMFVLTGLKKTALFIVFGICEMFRILISASHLSWLKLVSSILTDLVCLTQSVVAFFCVYFLGTEILRLVGRPRLALADLGDLVPLELTTFTTLYEHSVKVRGWSDACVVPELRVEDHHRVFRGQLQDPETREHALTSFLTKMAISDLVKTKMEQKRTKSRVFFASDAEAQIAEPENGYGRESEAERVIRIKHQEEEAGQRRRASLLARKDPRNVLARKPSMGELPSQFPIHTLSPRHAVQDSGGRFFSVRKPSRGEQDSSGCRPLGVGTKIGLVQKLFPNFMSPTQESLIDISTAKYSPLPKRNTFGRFTDSKVERWFLCWKNSVATRWFVVTYPALVASSLINVLVASDVVTGSFMYWTKMEKKSVHWALLSVRIVTQLIITALIWAESVRTKIENFTSVSSSHLFVSRLFALYMITMGVFDFWMITMFEPSKLTLTSRSISMITQMILLPFYLIVTQGINLVVLLVICGSLICSHVFAPTRSPIMFADFVPLVAVALVQHFWVARPLDKNFRHMFASFVLPYLIYLNALRPVDKLEELMKICDEHEIGTFDAVKPVSEKDDSMVSLEFEALEEVGPTVLPPTAAIPSPRRKRLRTGTGVIGLSAQQLEKLMLAP